MNTNQIILADETSSEVQADTATNNPGVAVIVRRMCYANRAMIAWATTYQGGVWIRKAVEA